MPFFRQLGQLDCLGAWHDFQSPLQKNNRRGLPFLTFLKLSEGGRDKSCHAFQAKVEANKTFA